MNPPSTPSGSSLRRKKKRSTWRRVSRSLGHLWQDWRIEILIAVLLLVAVFLLVERMNIRQSLHAWLLSLLNLIDSLIIRFIDGLASVIRGTTLSDLVAYLLLVAVLCLVVWRARHRLMARSDLGELRCPRCGSDLNRIRRRKRDRALNLFLPVKRYRCRNRDCQWKGLRIVQPHSE